MDGNRFMQAQNLGGYLAYSDYSQPSYGYGALNGGGGYGGYGNYGVSGYGSPTGGYGNPNIGSSRGAQNTPWSGKSLI